MRAVALVDEPRCIGCARCLEACPVDAIVGAQGLMHTVVETWCIGCRLCVPACPVDCIAMVPPRRPWNAGLRRAAGERGQRRRARLSRHTPSSADRKAVLAQALARRRK